MRKRIIFILLFLLIISTSLLAQGEQNLSAEKYNTLYDSLMIEKSKLLTEKKLLSNDIDSLKNALVTLNEKWKSSRKSQLERKYGKDIAKRVANGQVWKGMNEKMLVDSWGKPDKVSKNKEKWGTFSQWYYGEITYFFKDGIMTDWEEKK